MNAPDITASLRALIVEDNLADAELIVEQFRLAGYDPDYKRVETEAEFLAALDTAPEVILCDYTLPRFSGLRALALLHERSLDIPFILVSGTVGEDLAVDAMVAGARDYVLKDRLTRLVPAVQRELRACVCVTKNAVCGLRWMKASASPAQPSIRPRSVSCVPTSTATSLMPIRNSAN